jgi:general secretion pathway protein N
MTSTQARQLTRVLTVAVAGLAAVYLLLLAGFGRGVPEAGVAEVEPVPTPQLAEAQVDLPGLEVYDDLVQRPLFAEDRKPVPKEAEGEAEPEPETPPTAPLNVALTGIIHTPEAKIAMVRDNSTGRSLNLRERMPLPGDQGGWLVKAIEPRRVVFEDTGTQEETAIELTIGAPSSVPAGGSPGGRGGKPAAAPANAAPAENAANADDPVAQRAAEIRRRIEERRAQLRRNAQPEKQ